MVTHSSQASIGKDKQRIQKNTYKYKHNKWVTKQLHTS